MELKFRARPQKGTKLLGGQNFVVHCHHYNARIQNTIAYNAAVDGRSIWKESSRDVFYNLVCQLLSGARSSPDPKHIADVEALFSYLGYGLLSIDLENLVCSVSNSHFAKGWTCGSLSRKGCVCLYVEGFIEGALEALGRVYDCAESVCMNENENNPCRFSLKSSSRIAARSFSYRDLSSSTLALASSVADSNIDREAIVAAVNSMEIVGNSDGLIPAFNVYLANIPQDFYNLVAVKFVNSFDEIGLRKEAEKMLYNDAEVCAINTFGGILDSEEWASLVVPMIRTQQDQVAGLLAIANGLGWGRIEIIELSSDSLRIASNNNYESYGYRLLYDASKFFRCYMLRGISAGIMGLVYEVGEYEDRIGQFHSDEISCRCCMNANCEFCTIRV